MFYTLKLFAILHIYVNKIAIIRAGRSSRLSHQRDNFARSNVGLWVHCRKFSKISTLSICAKTPNLSMYIL